MQKINWLRSSVYLAIGLAFAGHALAQGVSVASAMPAVAVAAVAAAPAASSATAAVKTAPVGIRKENINTVDELLKIENAKAISLTQKDAHELGFGMPAATGKKEGAAPAVVAVRASLYVESISGVEDTLRANLSYNDMRYEGVLKGAPIGPCVITSIKNNRVIMTPASKKTKPGRCPSANWTGLPNPAEMAALPMNSGAPAASGSPMPGVGMPMPMPMPSAGVPMPMGHSR